MSFILISRHVLISASALLLVVRNFIYVGRHILISASVLLLVLRRFCYVGRHVLVSIIPYLRVLIVLRPSHLVLEVYAGKYLYVVYPNNKIHEIK